MKSAALFLVLSAFVLTTTGALDADEDGGRSPEVADPDELETVVEAWWRLEDCLVELPAPGESPAPAAWAAASRCGRLARIVARLGDESDRERLWLLYDDSIQAPHLRDQILEALLDWHVAHAIERQEARRPCFAGLHPLRREPTAGGSPLRSGNLFQPRWKTGEHLGPVGL